jgi:hypothetical protein
VLDLVDITDQVRINLLPDSCPVAGLCLLPLFLSIQSKALRAALFLRGFRLRSTTGQFVCLPPFGRLIRFRVRITCTVGM